MKRSVNFSHSAVGDRRRRREHFAALLKMVGLSEEEATRRHAEALLAERRDSYEFLRTHAPRLFAEVERRVVAGRTAAEIVALFPRANALARRRIRECAEYVRVERALRGEK